MEMVEKKLCRERCGRENAGEPLGSVREGREDDRETSGMGHYISLIRLQKNGVAAPLVSMLVVVC